ncbi:SAM-dependent DNA methyltransferase [Candidatus Bipolaricaulota bacterium]|nr:SAM-dependent DNA methyltransferase [Candidatus Bipolaricaulota bacterium]
MKILLSGVIDIVDFNETRNDGREISDSALAGIIETLSDPRYRLGLYDVEPDFPGRCYEYLLRKFAEGRRRSRTPLLSPILSCLPTDLGVSDTRVAQSVAG